MVIRNTQIARRDLYARERLGGAHLARKRCLEDGCHERLLFAGLCAGHWEKEWRRGWDGELAELWREDAATGCWVWRGPYVRRGSLRGVWEGRPATWAVWLALGNPDYPKWWQLHHRCRLTLCVNPAHLEPIEGAVHMAIHEAERRGQSRMPQEWKDAECPKGVRIAKGRAARRAGRKHGFKPEL